MRRLSVVGLVLAVASCATPSAPPQTTQAPSQAATVYFSLWSALIDPSAVDSIARVATLVKAEPKATVMVTGFADPEGSDVANSLLAQLRAQMVVDQLVADGVSAGRIRSGSAGAVGFAQSAQESRRAVIAVERP